jgi:type I restriction enzyme R subunit
LAFFPKVNRSVGGYEGLMAAQQCLPNNEVRDKFASEYTVLGTIWEALSPDACLGAYAKDYKWLTKRCAMTSTRWCSMLKCSTAS